MLSHGITFEFIVMPCTADLRFFLVEYRALLQVETTFMSRTRVRLGLRGFVRQGFSQLVFSRYE